MVAGQEMLCLVFRETRNSLWYEAIDQAMLTNELPIESSWWTTAN